MHRRPPGRAPRWLGAALTLLSTMMIAAACAGSGVDHAGEGGLTLSAVLPEQVPGGTKLVIGDPKTQRALELSGQIDDLPFESEWANFSGGPKTSEAFRAGALDVGAVADIPPLHARWTGLKVRIVAAAGREDPLRHPIYEFGVAPGVNIKQLSDLRGKRVAYSVGQAQGALVLRVLAKAGLTKNDVKLVELASTDDDYVNALASKQVDAAPLGGVLIKRYLTKFGRDGATTIPHGIRDDPSHLYVAETSLSSPAKAAAIRAYVRLWARAARWINEHPKEWAKGYYVEHEGLSAADAVYLVQRDGKATVPAAWGEIIARHQETADLLANEQGRPTLNVRADLYDLRFESVGGAAFTAGEKG
ncbi:ABC transporter substrate-binding protein [Actinomadura meridiana]|uniref:ABC transporter substrate-binding protein n=1 Tax=Actinomadura meridiana TaxID=559626 RepID=A0ABP8BWA2_9ACTN